MPGKLSTYTFTNADGYEVTLRLTAEDAKKRGLTGKGGDSEGAKARTPQNKSRAASTK